MTIMTKATATPVCALKAKAAFAFKKTYRWMPPYKRKNVRRKSVIGPL